MAVHAVNNTIADNGVAEAIWIGRYVSLTLTNNILAGHTVGVTNTYPTSSTVSADTNLFWDGVDPIVGINAIQQDPLLWGSYHLREGSPAVDAGVTVDWVTADLEGNLRPEGAEYDLGAFEGPRWKVYLPLAMRSYQ